MSKFHVGDRVRIHMPGNRDDGTLGTVVETDRIVHGHSRDWDYGVLLDDADSTSPFHPDELRPADIKAYPDIDPVPASIPVEDVLAALEPEPQPRAKYEIDEVISHPSHYTSGLPEGVEVIDIIRAQNASWEHSNAIKYLLRAQFKGNYKQDIEKAIQYLTWAKDRWAE